jgi:hypothetical protein
LHDVLNKTGIEIFNDAGLKDWNLTGDGNLGPTNLAVIKKAVQQSVDNINDPSLRAEKPDFAAYCAKVWKHIPQLTERAKVQVRNLSAQYTSPDSDMLVDASADLIRRKVDLFIRKLKAAKKLKDA